LATVTYGRIVAHLTLESITTLLGGKIEVPEAGVLCIVGGNNVGKSQLLREIGQHLSESGGATLITSSVQYRLRIEENPEPWLLEHSPIVSASGHPVQVTPPDGGQQYDLANLVNMFGHASRGEPGLMRHVVKWFVSVLDASSRAGVAVASGSADMGGGVGNSITKIFRDGLLEEDLSNISRREFGFPLTLDRVNGDLRLRVGTPDVPPPLINRPTAEYAAAVKVLPLLADQGDGVKNYLGMVLHLMTSSSPIVIIDEPEAFLHPAQARSLGRHLGEQARTHSRQLLTATHDRDFILGLLSAECPVTVIRLDRRGSTGTVDSLPAARVKAVWDRPALRYSNILQGLFHRLVVVCEGDADCRWYAAVLDDAAAAAGVASDEALFVPGGGKDQVPHAVQALQSLNIRTFALVDFDAILDINYLKALLEVRVDRYQDADLARIRQITVAIGKQVASERQRRKAKDHGLAGLPAGDIARLGTELLEHLRGLDVLVVPVGELESFDRTIGGHGPSWVTAALTAGRHKSTPAATALLAPVVEALKPSAPTPEVVSQ
jgi:energy-coupling factor transporter ATP-binding protein EcfA2